LKIEMLDRIKYLESIALRLEPSFEFRSALLDAVNKYANNFIDHINEIPAFVQDKNESSGIFTSPITEEGADVDSIISILKLYVDRPGLNPASGGHLGYIPGGGIFYSALGDFLADITNRFAGLFFVGPGAVRMENMLIDWMKDVVGYPKSAGGNLTSGGSIANLIGIVAARDAQNIKSKDIERSVIYTSSHVHHSVDKAIRIAGLKECITRIVSVDKFYRMDAEALEKMITDDRRKGLNPFLIIASAGTTDTGAIDPLKDISEIAKKYNLWFHVDGAYGAFFVLCDEGKKLLNGMENSDSLVMDPHKGLFLPYGTGTILVKDRRDLLNAFWYQANYLQDAKKGADEVSPADISPELTKHFRGLRLWLPLKLVGVRPFRAALEEKLLLARYFYQEIQKLDGFEVGPFPDLSIVTFRYIPKHGDPNEFNEKLIKAIQEDGRIFISSTMLDGKFTLRLAVLAFRTHLSTIELALEVLKEKVKMLID